MGGRAGGGAGLGSGSRGGLQRNLSKYESAIRGHSIEIGYIFDENGNLLTSAIGDEHHVPIDGTNAPNNIFTHNHPNGAAFSGGDMEFAVYWNAKEIRATGKEYTYSLKRPKSGWGKTRDEVVQKWNKLYDDAGTKYLKKATGNATKDRKLWIKLTTDISKTMAKDFGWDFSVKKNK